MLPCIKGDLRWLVTTAQMMTSNKYKLCLKLGLIKIAPICASEKQTFFLVLFY